MKVIVAGYSKTGTKTLNAALATLGYNVYDFLENSFYLREDWNRIFDKGVQPGDFERMYKGVDAVMDIPCYYYWKELSEAFPEAKIVLMVRDEVSWYRSLVKQANELSNSWLLWGLECFTLSGIMKRKYRYHIMKFLADTRAWPSNKLVPQNENTLKRMYREHNLYVQTTAPKDRLLLFKLSDGWKPLCDFLGSEIPDKPFPHENKGASVFEDYRKNKDIVKATERELRITLLVFVVVITTLVYQIYHCLLG